MKEDSSSVIHSIETPFDEEVVTPFLVHRDISKNPDYKSDNFFLCLYMEMDSADYDTMMFSRFVPYKGDTMTLEKVKRTGVRLFFNDGSSLKLDSAVEFSGLNNDKNILTTYIAFDRNNIGPFLSKELVAFSLVERQRKMTLTESQYLREAIRCAASKKPLENGFDNY